MGKNYYEVLGIGYDADIQDIKRAYFNNVRRYPPEKYPEEFKRLREAYDTLYDEENRREYDENSLSPEFANKNFELGRKAYEEEDYDTAEEQLEKAFMLSPSTGYIRNLLGLTYIELGKYKKAVDLFSKLANDYPDRVVFHVNYGFALYEAGSYTKAEKIFRESIVLDIGHESAWTGLSDCLVEKGDYTGSRECLLNAMDYCGENLYVYEKLIDTDIKSGNIEDLRSDIGAMSEMANEDDILRKNVTWVLESKVLEYEGSINEEYADMLLEKSYELNPDEPVLKRIHNQITGYNRLSSDFKRFEKDERIDSLLIKYFEMIIDSSKDVNYFSDITDAYERFILNSAYKFTDSAMIIKKEYDKIFSCSRTFINRILKNPQGIRLDLNTLKQDIKIINSTGAEVSLDKNIYGVNVIKVGRNDPCPCGSGKKYKNCCLKKHG
jgi:preprotein translocase subunit SecA